MAVNAQQEFVVRISADSAEAKTNLNAVALAASKAGVVIAKAGDSAKDSAKGFESLSGRIVSLAASFQLMGVVTDVFRKVADAIAEPVKMAAEAEQNNMRLATSLKIVGLGSEEAMEGIEVYANQLKKLSGIDDDLIKRVIATNVAIGMTIPQAEEAASAAAGLAKFLGTDLDSANHMLIGSLSGMTREIQKVVPGVASLTVAQLRHGDAIKLVSKQTQAFLADDAGTMLGVLDRLKIGWEDLKKQVGSYILTGLDAKGNFAALSGAIDDLGKFFKDNQAGIQEFARTIGVGVVSALKELAALIKEIGPILPNLGRQFADLTKTFVLPFVNVLVSASSIIARISGDRKLEDAMDRLREKLSAMHKEGVSSLRGLNQIPPVDWDKRLNTNGLKDALDKQQSLLGKAKDSYDQSVTQSFKAMGNEQAKGIEASKANVSEWTSLYNKIADVFRAKKPMVVEPPSLAYLNAGPPRSAMTAQATAETAKPQVEIAKLADTGKIKLALTRDQLREQLDLNRSFEDQRLAIELSYGDSLTAAKVLTLRKISQQEKDAADKDLKVSTEASKLRLAVEAKFQRDMAQVKAANLATTGQDTGQKLLENAGNFQKKMLEIEDRALKGAYGDVGSKESVDNTVKAFEEAARVKATADRAFQIDVASRTDDTFSAISLKYDQDVADFQAMLDKKQISQDAFDQAMGKAGGQKTVSQGAAVADQLSISNVSPPLAAADKIADAVQGLIDFLPNFLNKISHIFDSLRDLPLKLASAVTGVFTSVTSFFGNISQNMTKAVGGIMDGLTSFIDKLPAAISSMITNFPSIIQKFIQKIPDLVGSIVKSFITFFPTMITSWIQVFVQGLPAIVHELIKMIVTDLPGALASSFKAAISMVGDMIKSLLTGKKLEFPDMSKQLAHLSNSVKGSASQLFNIQDFKKAASSFSLADQVAKAIDKSMFNLAKMMGQLWRFFVTALQAVWQWVYDKILAPIWGIVTSAFQFAAKLLMTVWDALVTVANFVASVLYQVWDGLRGVVMWASGILYQAWDGLRSAVSYLSNVLSDAWGRLSGLVSSLGDVFTRAVRIFDPIVNFRFPEFRWPDLPQLTIQKPSWWNLSSGGPVGGIAGRVSNVVNNTVKSISSYVSARSPFAQGGLVRGGVLYAEGGSPVMGTDTVPAMLTPGEYVINRHAAGRVGLPALERLNAGQGLGGGGLSVSAPITINTTQPVDANFIRQTLVPTMLEAIKSATENGRYVINKKGIRA